MENGLRWVVRGELGLSVQVWDGLKRSDEMNTGSMEVWVRSGEKIVPQRQCGWRQERQEHAGELW